MGYTKYHEDNIKLYDERMYYRGTTSMCPCVTETFVPKHIYKYHCPFCSSGFDNEASIAKHIIVNHGGKTAFIYLNDKRVYEQDKSEKYIYSLTLFCFNETPVEVKIQDDFDRQYRFWTQSGKFEYNIQNYIKDNVFSFISVNVNEEEYRFKQLLDINVASIDKILAGKYVSDLFYEQISEELFTPREYLSFLKMLIHEGRATSDVMIRVGMMDYDWNNDTRQLYWYHYLASEQDELIPQNERPVLRIIHQLFEGDVAGARAAIDRGDISGNDKAGCLLVLGLLAGDSLTINYQTDVYAPEGLLGTMIKVLEYFYYIESDNSFTIGNEIDEISVFHKYPTISALLELYDAINKGVDVSRDTYELLRGLSPLASIAYCRGLDDETAKEKIYKSAVKIHSNSGMLKRMALDSNYSWIYRRLSISDGKIYRDAVRKVNKIANHSLSERYINEFPINDEIVVTPLGGEKTVGASCFVVSYHGLNIMLDCGINPYTKGEEAYPALDDFTKQIDYILLSHAHIDHSGALVKAHAMWPNAKIYMTAPTRVFVEYIFSDMAKVNNGINKEFEIDIVEIEKTLMIDTLKSINIIDFDEGISLGHDIKVKFHPAGHIQGAAMIEMEIDEKKLLYTGDFAAKDQVLTTGLQYGELPQNVDYLITESTYIGKSIEDKNQLVEDLKKIITEGLNHKKAIILPAMAVGRSQELACIVGEMKLEGMIDPDVELSYVSRLLNK